MRADVFAPADLPLEMQAAWRAIQRAHPTFAGPCFHPRLFQAIAEGVAGVKIAVLTHDSGALAFMPYLQVGHDRIARPVPACDYQGIIADPALRWDMREILARLNLVAWDVEHLVAVATTRPPFGSHSFQSPCVILSTGFAGYAEGQRLAGKSGRNLKVHRRLLLRNHGEVRFIAQSSDHAVLRTLVQWKADRFSGFAAWARNAMESIRARPDGEFSSVLSTLSAGDTLVAAHFGLRCDGILYYWFPGFETQYARYSVGRLLLEDLIAGMPALGCNALDLGPGGETYKDYFANDSRNVVSGHYERPALRTFARSAHRGLRDFVKSRPLLYRALRPLMQTYRGALRRLHAK